MRKHHLFFLSALLLAAACAKEPVLSETGETASAPTVQDDNLIPGVLVVQLSDAMIDAVESSGSPTGTKSAAFNALSEMLAVRSVERVFPDAGRFEERHRAAGLHRWYRIRYDAQASTLTKAAQGMEDLEGVLSVEVPRKKKQRAFNYFNDPYARYQWHYYNDGSLATGFRKGADANVVPVWNEFTTGSKNVIVAVIDSGVEGDHEDLAAAFIPAGPEGSRNFASSLGEYEIKPGSHGTHVAGTIGAVNNNGIGVCGIAGGKDGTGGVRIMSCSISSGEEGDTLDGDAEEALVWAADHGAVIANNSWGYSFDEESQARAAANNFASKDSALKSAIDYFIAYAGLDEHGNQTGPMKGGVVLFASGNEGWQYDVPAMYEAVVAVGAFQPDNSITDYSNYGPWVDVWAPGGADSGKADPMIFSTLNGNTYAWMSGTSQACPHAAGVAALLVSHFGKKGFTNDELVERLVWGAKYGTLNTKNKTVGGGRLDAYGAFTYSGRTKVTFETDYKGGFTFKSHEGAEIVYTIKGNDDGLLAVQTSSTSPVIEVSATNTSATFRVNALKGEAGKYKAGVTVGDGTQFEAVLEIEVEVLENHAPEAVRGFDNLVLDAATAEPAVFDLTQYFSDADGENLNYKVEFDAASVASSQVSAGSLTLKPSTYGQTNVTVVASDARGASARAGFVLLARDLSKPLDLYPNPVSDYLYVRPESEAEVQVAFYNQAGACVLNESLPSTLFNPARLNVRDLPAGSYTVVAAFGGKEVRQTIVKL